MNGDVLLKKIIIENFKSYSERTEIEVSEFSAFLGANSSGKSTALQTLLALKQTVECNSSDIELLLCGKYVTLGDFTDVINDPEKNAFKIGVLLENEITKEKCEGVSEYQIEWEFTNDKGTAGVKLDNVLIECNAKRILLKSEREKQFRLYYENQLTELGLKIANLSIEELRIYFDKEFNSIYKELIDSIVISVCGNKSKRADLKSPMFLRNEEDMFVSLMQAEYNAKEYLGDCKNKVEKLSRKFVDLLKQYSEVQRKYVAEGSWRLPDTLKVDLLNRAIICTGKYEEFEKNYVRFQKKLEAYKRDIPAIDKWEGNCRILESALGGQLNKRAAREIDDIRFALDVYGHFQEKILGKIFFVGPIRENPQGLYNIGFDTIPKYVGPTGAYFASVLLHQNKRKKYFFPEGELEETTLLEALAAWSVHLNIASEVKVDKNNSFGFNVSIANTENKISDIMNVGIGTSQVLPVLITGLLSEEEEVLVFEQPELHLHPYSQSRLADFFVELIKYGRSVIVETHSEYFLLRLRYHVLMENIAADKVNICFFQNKEGTKVRNCEISGFGNLDYPEDFYDETQELLNELMNAALMKRVEEY